MKTINTYVNPTNEWTQFKRVNNREYTSWFYVIRIHDTITGIRYIKIGTTERTINARFKKYKYDNYKIDEIYFIAEVSESDCYEIEDHFRDTWRERKGFTFVRNDRFKYFNVPKDFESLIKSTLACA